MVFYLVPAPPDPLADFGLCMAGCFPEGLPPYLIKKGPFLGRSARQGPTARKKRLPPRLRQVLVVNLRLEHSHQQGVNTGSVLAGDGVFPGMFKLTAGAGKIPIGMGGCGKASLVLRAVGVSPTRS
jgi:hypothetical protein